MSWLFEAVFEASLHHRLVRWIVLAVFALIALWFGGISRVETWLLFIGFLLGLAVLFKASDYVSSRNKDQA